MKLDARLRPLLLALRKLDPEQGRIARGHARARVKRAVKVLLVNMDATFPLERKPPKLCRQRRTPAMQVTAALRSGDWVEIPGDGRRVERLAALAEAGIRVRRFKELSNILVPAWTVAVEVTNRYAMARGVVTNVTVLRKLKRNITARKAAIVRAAMIRGV